MNKEKLLSKIGSLIDKGGFSEEELTALFHDEGDVAKKDGEQPEGKVGEAKPEDKESAPGSAQDPEEKPEGEAEGEPKPVKETAVPPEEPKEEGKPAEEPPAWEAQFNDLASKIEALSKENESLRDALRKAKVLEDAPEGKQVGYGTSATPNLGREETDLSATLAKLNRGRK